VAHGCKRGRLVAARVATHLPSTTHTHRTIDHTSHHRPHLFEHLCKAHGLIDARYAASQLYGCERESGRTIESPSVWFDSAWRAPALTNPQRLLQVNAHTCEEGVLGPLHGLKVSGVGGGVHLLWSARVGAGSWGGGVLVRVAPMHTCACIGTCHCVQPSNPSPARLAQLNPTIA
jgi:hypothetical protein